MSVTTLSPITPDRRPSGVDPYRLSVEQYHRMIDLGVLGPEDRVELIEGELISRMSKSPPHSAAMTRLQRRLSPLVPGGHVVRWQDPVTLNASEPEPDAAIVRASPDDYATRHPSASEILLLVEVADTSLEVDLGLKLGVYARAGVPHYWVLNLRDRRLEVFASPSAAGYASHVVVDATGTVAVPGTSVVLAVSDVLP